MSLTLSAGAIAEPIIMLLMGMFRTHIVFV